MRNTRRVAMAAFIGLGVGFGLALYFSPTLRKKVKELTLVQSGEFLEQVSETWSEYPQRIAYAISAGREAARTRQEELEKVLSSSDEQESIEEMPKYII